MPMLMVMRAVTVADTSRQRAPTGLSAIPDVRNCTSRYRWCAAATHPTRDPLMTPSGPPSRPPYLRTPLPQDPPQDAEESGQDTGGEGRRFVYRILS
eukprot:7041529-Pyramimonas_sp.AAC.2